MTTEHDTAAPSDNGAAADGAGDEPRVYVCDLLRDDGEVCGATFTGEKASIEKANHTRRDHPNHRNTERKRGGKRAGAPTTDKPPTRPRAPKGPTRADQYQIGLGTLAMLAFVAPGPFDAFDLTCVTNGAAQLAPALADVAEQNATVRQVCDLVLGGGAAGPYAALVFAALSIAAPIAAHHGLIPAQVGERFGASIGVSVPAPPAPSEPAPDAPAAPAPASADDVFAFLESVPTHVMADVAGRMMGADRPVVAVAPDIGGVTDAVA